MFSPLQVLSVMLALVLGGQIVLAAIEPGEQTVPRNIRHDEGPGGGPYIKSKINFVDQDRLAIHNYYVTMARSGSCPIGLARTEKGCLPLIEAKTWRIGRSLPRDVIFHNLPADLTSGIAAAPPGYRYVRVGGDVLLIARGSGIVVAAIEDLART